MKNKNRMKKLAALIMGAALMFVSAGQAMADDSNITYQGGAEAFVIVPDGKDLFQNFKGVMPGDSITQKVIVSNTVTSSGGVRIYLRAETGEETAEGFLEQMALTVMEGSQVLSEASANQPGGLTENILLGEFHEKGQIQMDLSLTVPITMGNEFQDAAGTIHWIFTAEELDGEKTPNSSGGGNGGGGGGGRRRVIIDPEGTPTTVIDEAGTPLEGLTPSPEQIDDEEVPLSNNPITQMIEDVLVPLGLLPKTGDGSVSYAPLLALMAASGLLIIGIIWRRVRKTH